MALQWTVRRASLVGSCSSRSTRSAQHFQVFDPIKAVDRWYGLTPGEDIGYVGEQRLVQVWDEFWIVNFDLHPLVPSPILLWPLALRGGSPFFAPLTCSSTSVNSCEKKRWKWTQDNPRMVQHQALPISGEKKLIVHHSSVDLSTFYLFLPSLVLTFSIQTSFIHGWKMDHRGCVHKAQIEDADIAGLSRLPSEHWTPTKGYQRFHWFWFHHITPNHWIWSFG